MPGCGMSGAMSGASYEQTAQNDQDSGDRWQNHGNGATPQAIPISSESGIQVTGSGRSLPAPRPAYQPSPPPARKMAMEMQSSKASGSLGSTTYGGASSAPSQGKAASQVAEPQRELQEAMVVYMGYLRLRVKRQMEAVDAITLLAKQHGGYVESLSGRALVVRVPARDFDGVMAEFASVGEVLDRRVKALDVSRQFTDVRARLAIAHDARGRLLLLLRTVTDVEERLQILEEIKRLTEQIETAESVLATLRNLADFFTITVELEPVVAQTATSAHRSPFPWVRKLSPYQATLADGKKRIDLQVPRGFVQFEDDDLWRAQAADTAMLRAALVDNEPRGDAAFWSLAIAHELEGRDFEPVEQYVQGIAHVRVWRNKDVRPSYYLIATTTSGDSVCVVEAFLPNEAAWKARHDALRLALATLKVAP